MKNRLKLFIFISALTSTLCIAYAAEVVEKIDYSENLLSDSINKKVQQKNILKFVKLQDIKNIWKMKKPQNGVFGKNYRRIEFIFLEINKTNNNGLKYFVRGKNRMKQKICEFKGELEIIKAIEYLPAGESEFNPIVILGRYIFNEEEGSSVTGEFTGTFCSYCYYGEDNKILLDTRGDIADSYKNNTFVGTWTDLKRNKNYKCIWGDYRLPYTGDFDEGSGEFAPNRKYRKYGWQNYMEAYLGGNKKAQEIENEKWWLN